TLTVNYPDFDNDGLLDGTTLPEELLVLKRFNENTNRFEALLSNEVNGTDNQIEATTNKMGIFAILGEVPYSPVTITTQSLFPANPGFSYNATLGAAGGEGPYAWSIITGVLPTGLSLSNG